MTLAIFLCEAQEVSVLILIGVSNRFFNQKIDQRTSVSRLGWSLHCGFVLLYTRALPDINNASVCSEKMPGVILPWSWTAIPCRRSVNENLQNGFVVQKPGYPLTLPTIYTHLQLLRASLEQKISAMKLTSQMSNELHPLLNEVRVLHEHLSNCLVWQDIDEVAHYWPVTVVD